MVAGHCWQSAVPAISQSNILSFLGPVALRDGLAPESSLVWRDCDRFRITVSDRRCGGRGSNCRDQSPPSSADDNSEHSWTMLAARCLASFSSG